MPKTKNPALHTQRKALICDTAQRLLTEGPVKSVTLDRVAREAGVSKGLVNYYFKGKDDLLTQTIRRYHEQQGAALLAVASQDAPARERLRWLVDLAFPSHEAVRDELKFQTEVWSYAKVRPEVWEALCEAYRGFRFACEGLLRLGVDEGYVKAKDPGALYLIIHAVIDGLSFQVAVDPELDLDAVRAQCFGALETLITAPGR